MRASTTRGSSSSTRSTRRRAARDIRVRTRVTRRGARAACGARRCEPRDGATSRSHARARIVNAGRAVGQGRAGQRAARAPAKANVRHVKGSHIVVPRVHPEEHAYILQNADNRIVFVIPYQEHYSLIGTTDVAGRRVRASAHFRRRDRLPADARQRVSRTAARAEPTSSGPTAACGRSTTTASHDPSAVTRDYVLKVDALDGATGADRAPVLSIFGGKITTYRKLAEHALRELAPYFPGDEAAVDARPRRCRAATCRRAIATRGSPSCAERYPQLPADAAARRSRDRHGTRALRVLGDAQAMADLGERFRRRTHGARDRLSGRARNGRAPPTTCCGGAPSAACR